jgi:hypothetical protein
MRIGLNSGPVVVGAIGDALRMDYTAKGFSTNLSSRMDTMAEPGSVLVSDNTYRLVKDCFEFVPQGKVQVKGKAEPLDAYELVKVSEVVTRFDASVARGLTTYVGRRTELAILKQALERSRAGAGQVVGIVGEAGVGKWLVLELRKAVSGEYMCLAGHCLEFLESIPFQPLLDILRTYFGIKEGDQENGIRQNRKKNSSRSPT